MEKKDLLKNEQIERLLSPHPLSFIKLQALSIFVIVWGIVVWWLTKISGYAGIFSGNAWYPLILWGLVLLLVGVVAWLTAIQLSIFLLYLAVFAGAVGLILWQHWEKDMSLVILVYSVAVSIVGFLIVELYRRSHKYIITNFRLIFKGGVLTKRERTIRYDKIADIDYRQGVLGQIFGFGTIIPISEAGFGLGSDKSGAAAGVELGTKKAKVIGLVGTGKEVQTPIARSYYELHGVYPYKEIKKVVENLVQTHVPTQYQKEQVEFQKEQVDIQKQMRDLLHQQVRGKPKATTQKTADEEDEEPEEEEEPDEESVKESKMKESAFPPDQVDIQKQMKELLKKQKTVRATAPNDEEEEDEEEPEEEDAKKKEKEDGREVA